MPGANLSDTLRERRSKFDIVARLLQVASEGSTKTSLVYQSNLNFKVVQKYLDMLRENGLLEVLEEEGSTLYRTTRKGVAALRAILSAKELITGDPEAGWPPAFESKWRNTVPKLGGGFDRRAQVFTGMAEPGKPVQ